GAGVSAGVPGSAVPASDDPDAGLVVLRAVNAPPRPDSDPEQPTTTRQRFDLGRCGIVSEIQQGTANAVADDRARALYCLRARAVSSTSYEAIRCQLSESSASTSASR